MAKRISNIAFREPHNFGSLGNLLSWDQAKHGKSFTVTAQSGGWFTFAPTPGGPEHAHISFDVPSSAILRVTRIDDEIEAQVRAAREAR